MLLQNVFKLPIKIFFVVASYNFKLLISCQANLQSLNLSRGHYRKLTLSSRIQKMICIDNKYLKLLIIR